jgi:hypothetical protein
MGNTIRKITTPMQKSENKHKEEIFKIEISKFLSLKD